MSRIKIEDLKPQTSDAPLPEADLDSVVGGALLATSTSYFLGSPDTYTSPTLAPRMPLPGGSLTTEGGLFGVRG